MSDGWSDGLRGQVRHLRRRHRKLMVWNVRVAERDSSPPEREVTPLEQGIEWQGGHAALELEVDDLPGGKGRHHAK
jgi:hypothetical protein